MTLGPNQQKWVNALRSGEYSQAKNALHNNDGYCCLGVACRLAEKDGVKLTYSTYGFFEDEDLRTSNVEYILGGSLLEQPRVKDWIGLKSTIGSYKDKSGKLGYSTDGEFTLAGQNDRDVSFAELADIIEENADQLFEGPK